jgi:hypothetical protein
MTNTILLIAWRSWYARNKVTHDKSLPSIESSKRFLCSYICLIRNIEEACPDVLMKSKQHMVEAGTLPAPCEKEKGPHKPWAKPQLG